MPTTLAQLAETLDVAKSTVIRNAKRLGIYDEMEQRGTNNTRIVTDEQAVLLAREIKGRTLTAADLGGASDIDVEDIIGFNAEIAELKSALAERDGKITDLTVTIAKKDEEIAQQKAEIAILRRMRQEDQDCIAGLMGAWPWQKRKILADHKREIKDLSAKLLPPAAMAQAPADQVADAVYETPGDGA